MPSRHHAVMILLFSGLVTLHLASDGFLQCFDGNLPTFDGALKKMHGSIRGKVNRESIDRSRDHWSLFHGSTRLCLRPRISGCYPVPYYEVSSFLTPQSACIRHEQEHHHHHQQQQSPQVGEWFRARNSELRDASEGKKKEPVPPPNTPQKPPTEPLADKETIPSPSVLAEQEQAKAEAVPEQPAAATAAGAAEGGGDAEKEGEKEKEEGGAVVAGAADAAADGDEDKVMKGLRMSEEELTKLKEEQEERCKELAMNVNVFMPYEVPYGFPPSRFCSLF